MPDSKDESRRVSGPGSWDPTLVRGVALGLAPLAVCAAHAVMTAVQGAWVCLLLAFELLRAAVG